VRQAGVPPVVAHGPGDRLVLPEHHAPQQGGIGGRHPLSDRPLRRLAQAVDRAGQAAAAPAGGIRPVEQQLPGDAPPAKVGGEVELLATARAGATAPTKRPQLTAHHHLPADGHRPWEADPAGNTSEQPGPAKRAAGDPDLDRSAESRGPRMAQHVGAPVERGAVANASGGCVDRGQARIPHAAAREQ
jgi:hypothetical protein